MCNCAHFVIVHYSSFIMLLKIVSIDQYIMHNYAFCAMQPFIGYIIPLLNTSTADCLGVLFSLFTCFYFLEME